MNRIGINPLSRQANSSHRTDSVLHKGFVSVPHLTLSLSAGGPILDLAIGVSRPRSQALQKANQPVPNPVRIRGLIDTGASGTCVDPVCLASLGLGPTGQVQIHTPSTGSTPQLRNQYDVSIILIHPNLVLQIHEQPAIASTLQTQGIQALIGRDVLARCLFVYDGAMNLFMLAFWRCNSN